MKHVNDEFWQKFAPAIVDYAKSQGIDDFYMFGEVAEDFSQPFLSHFTTHDDVQGVLDFPFQRSRRRLRGHSARPRLETFFDNDDWYTDGDSNVYNLPTFLGNHDRGRIGMFLRNANPGAAEAELLARDKLAHALMYFSRGNPVIYYGDEQGFTGAGGDQDARQDMFPSQSRSTTTSRPDRGRRRRRQERQHRLGRDADGRQLRPRPRALPRARRPGRGHAPPPGAARRRPAAPVLVVVGRRLRVLAHRPLAQARVRRRAQQRGAAGLAAVPTFVPSSKWEKVWGSGAQRLRTRRRQGSSTSTRRAAVGGRLPLQEAHPAQPPGAGGLARRVRHAERRPRRGGRRRRRRLVLRGHVPRQGRQRRAGRTSARTTTRPTASSRTSRTSRRARRSRTRRSCSTTRATRARARSRTVDGPAAGDHDRGAERGPARPRQRRGRARSRRRSSPTTS